MIRYLILFDPCRTQDSQHRINFKIPISTQILLSRCFLNKRTLLTPPNVSIDPPGQHWVQSRWAEHRSSLLCPLAALPSSKKRVQQPVDLCAPMLWQVSCLQEVATQTPYLEKKNSCYPTHPFSSKSTLFRQKRSRWISYHVTYFFFFFLSLQDLRLFRPMIDFECLYWHNPARLCAFYLSI